MHPTHNIEVSMSSQYDFICTECRAADNGPEGEKILARPCREYNMIDIIEKL